jgi:hypothetical protein
MKIVTPEKWKDTPSVFVIIKQITQYNEFDFIVWHLILLYRKIH